MKLIECVPNFSEGNSQIFINGIKDIVENSNNVQLLDIDPGKDTNRTVLTFIGEPNSVINVAYKLIEFASVNIDMRNHKGEHPRMGATDVCPLIPLQNVTMNECIELSKSLASKVASKLNIPIYLYENSAKNNYRKNLSDIRSGEYENLVHKLGDKKWKPDFGPTDYNNPIFNISKTGATAIGAREFLIAYNINLNTTDKKIATDIALDIREAGRFKRDSNNKILRDRNGIGIKKPGKLKFCKAVGWYINEYKQAQVSINLINYKVTSIHKTFEEVRMQARKRGIRVTGSEVVGLLPKKALIDSGNYYLKKQKKSIGIPEEDIINIAIKSLGLEDISTFNPNKKIIEYLVDRNENELKHLSIEKFLNELSRDSFAPGGGSVSALAGSLGASLTCMVSNLTYGNDKYRKYSKICLQSSVKSQNYKDLLVALVDQDTIAYNNIVSSMRLPKRTKNDQKLREKEILKATINATNIPLEIIRICSKLIKETLNVAENSNPNCISDIGVASNMISSASLGAFYNILINIKDLRKTKREYYLSTSDFYLKQINSNHIKIIKIVEKILND
tara:strand:- start:4749 stop:6437 length:1689 start_codon:yes stop_codon:yes gene_type:complete